MERRGPIDWSVKERPATASLDGMHPSADAGALQAQSVEECAGADTPKPPTQAMKDVLRLRKKLREIAKLEERLAEGAKLDPLQLPKLEKKGEVAAQLAQAERAVVEEKGVEREAEEAAQGLAERVEGETLRELLETGQGLEQQQQQQHREQTWAWPMCALPMDELPSGPLEPSMLRHAQAWATAPAGWVEEWLAQPPTASSSARRRERRKRATLRARSSVAARASAEAEPRDVEDGLEELKEDLEAGGEARASALVQLHGSVARLAFDREGCRPVQLAIQVADQAAAAELLTELQGYVKAAVHSPHANFVLQAVITALPTAMSNFVVQELMGFGAYTARHRFGCRILCRLIEHSGASPDLAKLFDEVLDEAEGLCRHAFGHYVIQSMLEHLPERRAQIVQALRADLLGCARHASASRVVEAALAHCAEEERQALALELVGAGCEGLEALAQSQFGSFVLKALLRVPGRASEEAWAQISSAPAQLSQAKYAQRLLRDLGLLVAATAA